MFTDEEIRESYLDDITKYVPNKRVRRVWRNTKKVRGLVSVELTDYIQQKREKK